jgi:hypothetical protein
MHEYKKISVEKDAKRGAKGVQKGKKPQIWPGRQERELEARAAVRNKRANKMLKRNLVCSRNWYA